MIMQTLCAALSASFALNGVHPACTHKPHTLRRYGIR